MKWHRVPFFCDKGHKAQILEVAADASGKIAVFGICIICGCDVEKSFSMACCIASCAVADQKEETQEDPTIILLRDFEPKGKAN